MRESPASYVTRAISTITPDDTIGRVLECMRVCGLAELPVVDSGRVVGKVSETSILSLLIDGEPEASTARPVADVMSDSMICVDSSATLGEVAGIISGSQAQLVCILDQFGYYRGVVTRSDVAGVLTRSIRPPTIAGMATPLGVYLTTGHIRAGASDLGLFLTGVSMMLMNIAAICIIYGIGWVVQSAYPAFPLLSMLRMPYMHMSHWMDLTRVILLGSTVPLFLLMLRVFPLSGYHAAEHQVVHAIERGEPLNPSTVAAMPRVHPRCGTNVVAGVMLFSLVADNFSSDIALMLAVFVLVFAWRTIGGYFQKHITTKPASPGQIQSGIAAGQELLDLYREHPSYRVSGIRRFWNTGMPQVVLGVVATMLVVQSLHLIPFGAF